MFDRLRADRGNGPFASALITGATGGLGSAFARALPRETHLLLTARSQADLAAMAGGLETEGRTVTTVVADLATDDGRAAIAEAALAAGVDLFVANAGAGSFGRHLELDEAAERETVEVNVVATTVLVRRILPAMLRSARPKRGRAGLVLMSSTFAYTPTPRLATYAASKAYLLSYGEAIAEELSHEPVDVLTVCPGPVRTGFSTKAGAGFRRVPGAQEPADVVDAALAALGTRRVLVTGAGAPAFAPYLTGRRAVTGAIGIATRLSASGRRPSSRGPGPSGDRGPVP